MVGKGLTCLSFLRCNRYKAQQKADQTVSKARQNMAEEYRRKAERELEEKKAKFQHYHERYINHLNSLEVCGGCRQRREGMGYRGEGE